MPQLSVFISSPLPLSLPLPLPFPHSQLIFTSSSIFFYFNSQLPPYSYFFLFFFFFFILFLFLLQVTVLMIRKRKKRIYTYNFFPRLDNGSRSTTIREEEYNTQRIMNFLVTNLSHNNGTFPISNHTRTIPCLLSLFCLCLRLDSTG